MPFANRFVLAAALIAVASGAFAQEVRPDPFDLVPADRATQSADAASTERVFGGREVAEGEFPFQVALLRADRLEDNDGESQYKAQFCGGTLVAARWVLTAAHCMYRKGTALTPADFLVLTGSTDLASGQRVAVASIAVNEHYDAYSLDNDVALVELAAPVDIAPVALDLAGAPANKATVLGWGMTESGDYPHALLETDIDVVPSSRCNIAIKAIYATNLKTSLKDLGAQYRIRDDEIARVGDEMAKSIADPMTPSMLCAGLQSGQRDSCYGDSGGPLLAALDGKPVQLGIVSWGEGPASAEVKCGHQDVFGVYSRVASFSGWLTDHITAP